MQVTDYGRQTVPDRGVVRSCDPLQNFGGSNHITVTAEPKVVKYCTSAVFAWLTFDRATDRPTDNATRLVTISGAHSGEAKFCYCLYGYNKYLLEQSTRQIG